MSSIKVPHEYESFQLIELNKYIKDFPFDYKKVLNNYQLYKVQKQYFIYLQLLYFLERNFSVSDIQILTHNFRINFSHISPQHHLNFYKVLNKYTPTKPTKLDITFNLLKKIHNNFKRGYFRYPFVYDKISKMQDQDTEFRSGGIGLGIQIKEIKESYKNSWIDQTKYTFQNLSDSYEIYNSDIPIEPTDLLRIMSLNVHFFVNNTRNKSRHNYYKHSYYRNFYPIISLITKYTPDVVCLQEFVNNKKFVNEINKSYHCINYDNTKINDPRDLYNVIYVSKNRFPNITKIKKIASYISDKRYAVSINLNCGSNKLRENEYVNIICTHLSITNQTIREKNWDNLLKKSELNTRYNNHIIIGDFNDYRFEDYNVDTRKALLDNRNTIFKGINTNNSKENSFFSLIKKIEDDGYTDAFVKHSQNHNIPEEEQWKKIPANTSYHGGRVDYMFFSPKWDDNALPIAGVYKVYDNSSDHCPLILDLYVG